MSLSTLVFDDNKRYRVDVYPSQAHYDRAQPDTAESSACYSLSEAMDCADCFRHDDCYLVVVIDTEAAPEYAIRYQRSAQLGVTPVAVIGCQRDDATGRDARVLAAQLRQHIDQQLAQIADPAQRQAVSELLRPPQRVLITVRDGSTTWVADAGADIAMFDWDNCRRAPQIPVPSRFRHLAARVHVPAEDDLQPSP